MRTTLFNLLNLRRCTATPTKRPYIFRRYATSDVALSFAPGCKRGDWLWPHAWRSEVALFERRVMTARRFAREAAELFFLRATARRRRSSVADTGHRDGLPGPFRQDFRIL